MFDILCTLPSSSVSSTRLFGRLPCNGLDGDLDGDHLHHDYHHLFEHAAKTPDKLDDLTDIVPLPPWKLQRKSWRRSPEILWIQPGLLRMFWSFKEASLGQAQQIFSSEARFCSDDGGRPLHLTWLTLKHLPKQLCYFLCLTVVNVHLYYLIGTIRITSTSFSSHLI